MFLGAQWQTLLELTVHILSLGSFLIFFFCAASLSKSVILFINFSLSFLFYFFKDFIYLFLGRGEGKEKEKERNITVWLPLSLLLGPGLQPRHVPWLGIEPVTLWFSGCIQSTEPHQPGLFLLSKPFFPRTCVSSSSQACSISSVFTNLQPHFAMLVSLEVCQLWVPY